MKDEKDKRTGDLLKPMTKMERYRLKQAAAGLRQYAFWLTEGEAKAVRDYIERIKGAE